MSETIRVNGETKPLAALHAGATIRDLLVAERIDPDARFVAVAVNGTVLPRRQWPSAAVAPGDDIEIVRPAPGG
ncbi:MAG: sulfur carrier protein ThiS [Alphaproteobacteria bacterium]